MTIPIVAVTQRKGGPGKTTLARMLAEFCVIHRNKRVLLIDYDTQCNLSHLFVPMELLPDGGTRPPIHPDYDPTDPEQADWNGRSSSADIFYSGNPTAYEATRPDGITGLDVLPGDSQKLIHVEEQDRTALRRNVEERTREFFATSSVNELYDLVIIDTAPSASPLTRSALRAATHMLIPMELEEQCFEGMHEMLTMWRNENRLRPAEERLKILAIQPNKVKIQRLVHQTFLETLKNSKAAAPYLSPILIPDRAEYAERDTKGAHPRSIFHLSPSSKARQIAMRFGEYMCKELFGSQVDEAQQRLEEVSHG